MNILNNESVKFAARSAMTFGEALCSAHEQAMQLDGSVFTYGLGVDRTGAIFGSTKGLLDKFGPDRVFDGPVSEQALTMLAAGAANAGMRPILVHQRLDFLIYTLDQLTNWISLWHFKSAGESSMPLVIRAIVGKGWGQGPQHGKSLHSWFAHLPGLQVVMPSSPSEAKGLLLSSIFSNSPTIFIEGRSLYSMKEDVPNEPYFIKLGKAVVRRSGTDITVVSFGSMVPNALIAAQKLEELGISADVIDLRTISPIDLDTVFESVRRTGRIVVAEAGWREFGASGEIIAAVTENLFSELKASPKRVNWPQSHLPTSAPLEEQYYPKSDDIVDACSKALGVG